MEAIQIEVWGLLSAIVVGLIGAITTYLVKWLKKKGILAELDAKQVIVKDVVTFVEQVSKDTGLKGKAKFTQAKQTFVKILNAKGIKVTDDEVETLIESAVKAMNDAIKKNV